jgi:hypothetical protein
MVGCHCVYRCTVTKQYNMQLTLVNTFAKCVLAESCTSSPLTSEYYGQKYNVPSTSASFHGAYTKFIENVLHFNLIFKATT